MEELMAEKMQQVLQRLAMLELAFEGLIRLHPEEVPTLIARLTKLQESFRKADLPPLQKSLLNRLLIAQEPDPGTRQ